MCIIGDLHMSKIALFFSLFKVSTLDFFVDNFMM